MTFDDPNNAFEQKNKQLREANQSLRRLEERRASFNEITREYLTNGDLVQTLNQLLVKAIEYTGAQGGRFFRCAKENGEIVVTDVSEVCWGDLQIAIESQKYQTAFDEYAQKLLKSTGKLLVGTLEENKTIILSKDEYLAQRTIPLPIDHPEIESLILSPVSSAGKIQGVIILANRPGGFGSEEIADLKPFASEAALLIHADSREVARAAAEETVRLRNVFLKNMSHELRTPLNIIIGMNNLLLGMGNTKIQKSYLEKIGFSAQQLLGLVEDVLDLEKLAEDDLLYSISQLLSFKQEESSVELQRILELLILPLQRLQVQDIKPLIEQIQEKSWPENDQEQLAQQVSSVKNYQFNDAADLTLSLLSKEKV